MSHSLNSLTNSDGLAGVAELPQTSNINGCDGAGAVLEPNGTAGNQNQCRTFRAGDVVHHLPSDEEWTVAYVDGDNLAWCGWPDGAARISDCRLKKACSDEEHVKWLRDISQADGTRGRRARAALAAMSVGTTSFPFLKIARDFDLPYPDVVRFVSVFDGSDVNGRDAGFAQCEQLRGRRSEFLLAVNNAINAERERRANVAVR